MSKVKSTKKGKKNSDTKAIYAELPTLESETPEQMLNKLGGVAGRSMHEQPGSNQPPLLTQHSLAVSNSPVDIAHSVGLEPRSSHLDSSHLDGSHAGSSHLGSHQQLGDAPPPGDTLQQQAHWYRERGEQMIDEGHWTRAENDFDNAIADYAQLGELARMSSAQLGDATALYDAGHFHRAMQEATQANEDFLASIATGNVTTNTHLGAAESYDLLAKCSIYTAPDSPGQTAEYFKDAGNYFALAGYYEKSGNAYADAANHYASAGPEETANAASCWIHAGDNYIKANDFNNALTCFTTASTTPGLQHPGECFQSIGQCYMQLGLYSEAATAFHQASQDMYSTAYDNLDPNQDTNLWLRVAQANREEGNAYVLGGHINQAMAAYDAAISDLNYIPVSDRSSAKDEIWKDAGQSFSTAAENDIAAGHFNKAMELLQQSATYFNNAGDASAAQAAWSTAGHAFNAAVTSGMNPNTALEIYQDAVTAFTNAGDTSAAHAAEVNVGKTYTILANNDLAGGHYNKAASAFEGAAQAFTNVGDTSAANSSWQSAGRALIDAAQHDATAGHFNQAMSAYQNASTAFTNAGDTTEAKAVWAQAGQFLNNVGETDATGGHFGKAAAAYESAAQAFTNAGETTDAKAAWLSAGQDFSTAGATDNTGGHFGKAAAAYESAAQAFTNADDTVDASTAWSNAATCYVSAAKAATTDHDACKYLVDAYNADYQVLSNLPADQQAAMWSQMANEFGPGGLTTYFANHDSGWQAAAFAGALAQGALEKQENPTTPPMPS